MENTTTSHSSELKNEDQALKSGQSLIINPDGKQKLIATAKWANFIAIVGIIMVIFMVFVSISMILLSSVTDDYQDFQSLQYLPFPISIFGIFYLIMSVIYFFPCYYLFQFAKKIRLGMMFENQERLNEGLSYLKKLAKFVGILTIVLLSLMLLLIPITIISAGMMQALSGSPIA